MTLSKRYIAQAKIWKMFGDQKEWFKGVGFDKEGVCVGIQRKG
ncbi:MAG TPA: hypothetical protein VEP90_11375 [Methylomirabilota bacterium]|nr:hypothetical protein [Methylomirabilota bacterium]